MKLKVMLFYPVKREYVVKILSSLSYHHQTATLALLIFG